MIDINVNQIRSGIIRMFEVNFSLAKRERVLVVTDVPTPDRWIKLDSEELDSELHRSLLARYINQIGAEAFPDNQFSFYAFPATGVNGMDPPEYIGERMLQSEVCVALTSFSITHTKARNSATSSGVRVASMPGFLAEMFYENGVMSADYRSIAKKTLWIQEVLNGVSEVEVTTPAGTNLKFTIKGRPTFAETGLIEKYNRACNLPAGEAACSPIEGSANGTIIVEKGWHKLTKDEPAKLEVNDGLITRIEGATLFVNFFNKIFGSEKQDEIFTKRRNIAEFGIGTNPKAKRPDNTLEAEKIEGTIHIGYGNNFFMGGKVNADYHSDFVIPFPNVKFDGEIFMENGRIV